MERPWRWTAALAAGVSVVLSLTSPAGAQPPPAEALGSFEAWVEAQRDPAGRRCERRAAELDVDRTLIACGAAGLWVVQRAPNGDFVLASVQDLGGDVVGLLVRNGRIWAEVARVEMRPILRGSGGTVN